MTLQIDLTGHTAIITGATGQLGRVMVETLSECNAKIAIHYRNNSKQAEALLESLKAKGREGCTVEGDVGDFDSVMEIRETVCSNIGSPDIVVTNAVSQIFPWRTVLEEDLEDYKNQFRTCVMHNVNMAKAFIPFMQEKRWGRFIGINTECSIQTLETQSAYVSGKRGMDGVLRVLMKEVGPDGVTVNQVAPGWTISERDRRKKTETRPEYSQNVPLGRRGTDRDIANVVAFVASDLAGFMTGAFIPVNGGNAICAI